MFMCGDVSPDARRLCAVTKAALDAAIRECGPGVRFSRIGAVVSKLAKAEKCVPLPRSEHSLRAFRNVHKFRPHARGTLALCMPLLLPAGPLSDDQPCNHVDTKSGMWAASCPAADAQPSTSVVTTHGLLCRVAVVPLFCGHGVGKVFHASPAVMHTPNGEPDAMQVPF
jgi:methionine aminopeptidase